MKITTVRGALHAVQRKIVAGHGETVTYSSELDKTYGLLATEKAWYITRLLRSEDYVDFGGLFPELSKQIGWTRGVRLARQGLSAAIAATRKLPIHGTASSILVFVDEHGRFLQIGPATLMGFCEYMGLTTGRGNSWYAFPTIILSPVFGSERDTDERAALQRASLISQVNSTEADEDTRKEYFVDAVVQLGQPEAQAVLDSSVSAGIPMTSFDQFDFAGDGAVLAVLSEINRNLARIRELMEKSSSK
ncbi:MAG: hypothetical protein WAW16_06550 [Candidatus Cryosericum sp.]